VASQCLKGGYRLHNITQGTQLNNKNVHIEPQSSQRSQSFTK
jgi:hypothetical protein